VEWYEDVRGEKKICGVLPIKCMEWYKVCGVV
jgi:hypothetical protein